MENFGSSWLSRLLEKSKEFSFAKQSRLLEPPQGSRSGIAQGAALASGILQCSIAHEGSTSIDFDMGCFLLDENGQIYGSVKDNFVFYGYTKAYAGSIEHTGDVGNDPRLEDDADEADAHLWVNTSTLPPKLSKLLFVVSAYQGSANYLRKLEQIKFMVKKDGAKLFEAEFDPRLLGHESMIIVGYFDRKTLTFGAPGIALSGGFDGLANYLSGPNELMQALKPTFPNSLDVNLDKPMSINEQIHHMAWGPATLMARIVEKHYTPEVAQEHGLEILTRCKEAWCEPEMFKSRQGLVDQLLSDGVDWFAALGGAEDGGGLSMTEKITQMMAQVNGPMAKKRMSGYWEGAILNSLGDQALDDYLKGVSHKQAEVVFELTHKSWVLNYVSEKFRVNQLETDLGL